MKKSICFPMHGKRVDGLVFLCINQKMPQLFLPSAVSGILLK